MGIFPDAQWQQGLIWPNFEPINGSTQCLVAQDRVFFLKNKQTTKHNVITNVNNHSTMMINWPVLSKQFKIIIFISSSEVLPPGSTL